MSNLRLLSLESFSLEHMPPVICESLSNLQFLSLAHNRLDELPDQLFTLTSLKSIDLRGNRFQEVPIRLLYLIGLQRLVLTENEDLDISRDCVSVLEYQPSLREVYLAEIGPWNRRSMSNLMQLAKQAPAHLSVDVESLQITTHGDGLDVMPDRTVVFEPTDYHRWEL